MALLLYGVLLRNVHAPPRPPGVELLPVRDLVAAIEFVDAPPREVLQSDIARHAQVVQTLFEKDAVLPAPVGTVFKSPEALERWMDLHYIMLTDSLTWVERRVGARVHISRAANGASRLSSGAGVGPSAKFAGLVGDVSRQLRAHAVALVHLPSETPTVVSLAVLVEQDLWDDFASAVEAAAGRLPDLQIESTGPWPPYDFVRVQFGG
jgi:glycosyltransferase involved in cell wall biosynthesis